MAAIVKRLRLGLGISREELAHVCGYHRTSVRMIERGERNISIATLEALAGAPNSPTAFLMRSACVVGPPG